MISVIISSILTFIATEIDDFAVYVILYAQKKDKKLPIFLGQLTVIVVLAVLCAFVSIPLSKIPEKYLRFIGIIPFALGIWSIFDKDDDEPKNHSTSIFITSVILTLAASADNIGIYIPFFTTLTIFQKAISIGIFIILQFVWSFIQIKTADINFVQKFVEKTSRILVPVVFIALGLLIIFDIL